MVVPRTTANRLRMNAAGNDLLIVVVAPVPTVGAMPPMFLSPKEPVRFVLLPMNFWEMYEPTEKGASTLGALTPVKTALVPSFSSIAVAPDALVTQVPGVVTPM